MSTLMTDDEIKTRVTEFVTEWCHTGGEEAEFTDDWDKYGALRAHLFRFAVAIRDGAPSPVWDFTK